MLILWGQDGRWVLGTDIVDVNMGGGFGDRYGVVQCSYYEGWVSFGTDIGDDNNVGGLG